MSEEDNNPFQSEPFKLFARLHERSMAETESIQKWLMEQKDKRIVELEDENEELRARLARIERNMEVLLY